MRICLVAAAAAMALGACSTIETTVPTPEARAAFDPEQSAYLIVNYTGNLNCEYIIAGINKDGEPRNTVVVSTADPDYDSSTPAIMIVDPGSYRFSRGSCSKYGYYPISLDRAGRLHPTIDVEAGEVVYMGALEINMLRLQYSIDVNPALAGWWLADRGSSSFLLFQMVDESDEVRARLRQTHPDLADAMVTRVPEVFIGPEEFEARIRDAFLPGEDGVPPTQEEAQARFEESIRRDLERLMEEATEEERPIAALENPVTVTFNVTRVE